LSVIINACCFGWDYDFSNATSVALGYVIIGVCHTMKRERNGNQYK